MHVLETYAARNKRGQKRNEAPDSKPLGRWQNGLRRILDTLGQAALLRVRPGAFLFDPARLYTQAQRLDQPHHPQSSFLFLYLRGVGAGGALAPSRRKRAKLADRPLGRSFLLPGGLEGRSALQCMRSRSAQRALRFLRSEAEQRGEHFHSFHSFGVSNYKKDYYLNYI